MKKKDDGKKKLAGCEDLENASTAVQSGRVSLLVGTRKGAFILSGGKRRRNWKLSEPVFLGHMVHHLVQDLLTDLDRLYPGLRFRIIDEQDGIREHIKIFVDREQAQDLRTPVRPEDEVSILCALSGG